VPTILGELRRHFRDKGWMVRIPRSLQERRAEITATSQALTQALGRTPSTADVADAMGLQPAQVTEGVEAANAYAAASLDHPVGHGGRTLADGLADPDDAALERIEARLVLRDLLATLPGRERRILGLRYFDQLTQAEIAAELGISQMHVSRLLRRSLDAMREELLRAG
jgi:RNA polymerase sigma-B factor